MTPYGVNVGEKFSRFQTFSEEARVIAASHLAGSDYNTIFEGLVVRAREAFQAANDNEDELGDEVVLILLSREFMNMLTCWELCGRDMVLTKLTYNDQITY